MDPILEYVNAIMTEAKLDTLPDDMKLTIQDQLAVQAYRRIGVLIIGELGKDKADELVVMIEDPTKMDTDVINQYLTDHTKGFEQKLQDILTEMGAEFLQQMNALA